MYSPQSNVVKMPLFKSKKTPHSKPAPKARLIPRAPQTFLRLSEKHFAHICSDAYLAGAFDLEGLIISHISIHFI